VSIGALLGTDIAFFGNADFGQMGFGWAQAAGRVAEASAGDCFTGYLEWGV